MLPAPSSTAVKLLMNGAGVASRVSTFLNRGTAAERGVLPRRTLTR